VGYPSRVSGKGKAGPLEAGRGKYSPPANSERVTLEALKRGDKGFLRHEKICSRAVAHIPGANMKEFWLTILSEAERAQIQLCEPVGRVLDL